MKLFLTLALSVLLVACGNTSEPKNNGLNNDLPAPTEEEMANQDEGDERNVASSTDDSEDLDEDDDDEVDEGEEDLFVVATDKLLLEDFAERQMIQSPLELQGKVRRDWFFEGSFPITLMTLEGEVVKEWYGTGDWLEPLDDDLELLGEDLINFESTLEFEAPAEGDGLGKLRFGQSMVTDEAGQEPDFVEVMVLWP